MKQIVLRYLFAFLVLINGGRELSSPIGVSIWMR